MDCVYSNIGTIHNRPWVLSHPQLRIWNWWILVRVVFVQDVWVCTVSCSPTFGRNSVSFGTFLHIISLKLLSKPQRERENLKTIHILYDTTWSKYYDTIWSKYIHYSIFSHPFKNQVVQGMRGHLESSHVLPKAPSPCDWSVLWEQCSQIALLAETEQLLHVCLRLFVNAGTQGTFVSDSGVYSPCLRYLPVDWHQLSQSVLSGHHEVPFYDKSANKSVFLTIT